MTRVSRQGRSHTRKSSPHGRDICHLLSPPSYVPHPNAAELQLMACPFAELPLSIQSSPELQYLLLLQAGFSAALEEVHQKAKGNFSIFTRFVTVPKVLKKKKKKFDGTGT